MLNVADQTPNERLSTELYEKIFAEQENYRNEILCLPAEEILHHAYAYTIREDILLSLEYNNLSDKQCEILLKSEHSLEDVFNKWENSESPHMESIQRMIECTANEKLRADFKRSLHEER